MEHNCITIALANQKGGVSKTTTTHNLGYTLATDHGKKVLMVDMDPQANLTLSRRLSGKPRYTTGHLLTRMLTDEELPSPEEYILHTDCEHLDIIPASRALTVAETYMQTNTAEQVCLRNLIENLRGMYDYILIDTSPNLGALTVNGLVAADRVIIPIDPELYAISGVNDMIRIVERVRLQHNPDIEIMGLLLVRCVERGKLYKTIRSSLDGRFSDMNIFDATIPQSQIVGQANANGMAVEEFFHNHTAAIAYRKLAEEVVSCGK